jgi:hypothetical protein
MLRDAWDSHNTRYPVRQCFSTPPAVVEWRSLHTLIYQVRVEIMGPGKYENVGESQSVLIIINPIISTRTRNGIMHVRTGGCARRCWRWRRRSRSWGSKPGRIGTTTTCRRRSCFLTRWRTSRTSTVRRVTDQTTPPLSPRCSLPHTLMICGRGRCATVGTAVGCGGGTTAAATSVEAWISNASQFIQLSNCFALAVWFCHTHSTAQDHLSLPYTWDVVIVVPGFLIVWWLVPLAAKQSALLGVRFLFFFRFSFLLFSVFGISNA